MRRVLRDLRFALRVFGKSPLLTAAAVLSLALGIGANTTIFTLVNAVFLRPLPGADPDRVVTIFVTEEGSQVGSFLRISHRTFIDVEERTDVFAELAEIAPAAAILTGDGEAERLAGQMVTAGFFPLLAVEPALGRGFLPEEDESPGAHPVVVLNHRLFRERFGGDPAVLGRTLTLNGRPFTVVGVAPEGFHGTLMLIDPDFWTPLAMHEVFLPADRRGWLEDRRALLSRAYGRLRPGVSREQAAAALVALGRSLAEEHPVENAGRGLDLLPLSEAVIGPDQRRQFARAGGLLMTVVALVLLIACGNVANLLLARATARRREIAVRLALGASRSRLVGQLLTESLALALAAGALGLLLAHWGRQGLWALRPPFLEHSPVDLAFDARVLAFTLALSVATGVVFGLAPALQSTRPGVVAELKQEGRRRFKGGRRLGLRDLLVACQVAFSLVALVGSGLFLRSLGRALEVDLGFDAPRLASLSFDLGSAGFDPARGRQLYDEVALRARAVPGVEAAVLVSAVPLASSPMRRTVLVDGRPEEAAGGGPLVPVTVVGPGYFAAAGVPLLAGRDFEPLDDAESVPVAVVNREAARLLWAGEDPLDRRFQLYGRDAVWRVVGVAGDSKLEAVGEAPQPQVFLPLDQSYEPAMSLLLRAAGDPQPVLATVRDEVRRLAPGLPLTDVRTMAENVHRSLWAARMSAGLLGLLGALALLLVAVGIFGVASYAVSQRRHEIAVRIALGARRGAVLALVLARGMAAVGIGLVLGLGVALAAARGVGSLLHGLPPTDLATFAATPLLLAAVALLANLLPARRAASLAPAGVLRPE